MGEKSGENQLKRQKKMMGYEQYTLEELQKTFVKEQNPKKLNKIMGAISDKHAILSDDNDETNNV